MTRAAQKDEEIFFLSEFVGKQIELNVIEIKPALNEPPDGSVTIRNPNGPPHVLDFEIAEYYVDDPHGGDCGSPSKRTSSFWDALCEILYPRLETLRLPVHLHICLKEPVSLKRCQTVEFTDELIRFAQEFCPAEHLQRTEHVTFSTDSYPLLHEHIKRVALTHLKDTVVIGWDCSNAANVGVVTSHVSNVVRRKSAKKFNWQSGAEKCLLIYASGEIVTSAAGPPPPDPSIWDDGDLVATCTSSVFDRIYFWERVQGWCKRLK